MNAAQLVRRRLAPIAVTSALLIFAACSDDPASPIEGAGDPENIVRVTVSLTPTGGGAATTSVRIDPDGTQLPQPVGAAQGTLTLTRGTTYNGTITMLNDLDSKNIVDITKEVKEEANFHRFFYTFPAPSGCVGITVPVSSMDMDTQGTPQPVGLTFQFVVAATATTGSCIVHIELHHFEQNKGDGTGSTFDTDLSLDFPVSIS